MEVQIPSNGCSIYYGTYIDHYINNTRTRYYLNNEKLIKSSTSNYTSLPTGYSCLSQGDLWFKPELKIWLPLACFLLVVIAIALVYKIFIKRLMP